MSSLYDPGQELSSLDFGNLIGGPLSAVVDAQIRAAESTVSYIKDVGFDENGDPNYVAFTYPKEVSPYVAGEAHNIEAKVINGGSNYNVVPFAEIIGDGYGAIAEATMEGDPNDMKVKSIVISNQGYDYTNISEIKVLEPGGSGAEISINDNYTITGDVNFGFKEVVIKNGKIGSGYTHSPIIKATGNGSGAKLEAVINEDGEVIDILVINAGSGYHDGNDPKIFNGSITIENPKGAGADITINFTSGKASQAARFMDMKLEVPLLTMVPIPYIRVEETTINFNAKINSVERISSEQSIGANLNFSTEKRETKGSSNSNSKSNSSYNRERKLFKGTYNSSNSGNYSRNSSFNRESKKTKFNVSASYKRTDNRNTSIEKTYTMGILVKATQEEIPAGMEKVLGILENTIVSQPI
ncbi:MAG: DUF2589 domain-containing protein [Winogradskyella sp.]